MKFSPSKLLVAIFITIVLFLNLNCTDDKIPIEPSNTPPIVTIVNPDSDSNFLDGYMVFFNATATDQEDEELADSSLIWTSNQDGQFGVGDTCQIDTLSVNTHIIILTATDSHGDVGADTVTITIRDNNVPTVIIEGPADSSIFNISDTITFRGYATDPEDGRLTGNSLVWTSDIDGRIGSGDTLQAEDLARGIHAITLTATDSDSNSITTDVTVEIKITFERTYGGDLWDDAQSICPTSDGGYLMAGKTLSFGQGNYDVYIVKIDSLGNFEWDNTFGGSYFDWGYSISKTSAGYIITGYKQAASAYTSKDLYLISIDESGNEVWSNTFGGSNVDVGYSVFETSDGGYIVAGSSSRDNYVADIYLIKTNAGGEAIWENTYGVAEENEVAYSVCETSDGGFTIAGYKQDAGGYTDLYIFKTDATGTVLWENSFGSANNDFAKSIRELADGGFIITGYTEPAGLNAADVWLIRTDGNGNVIWENTYGGASDDRGYSVRETADAGFIISGYTVSSGAGDKDVYLIKTDNSGNVAWEKTFGGEVRDWGNSVLQTSDGGYIIGGGSDSWGYGGYYDVYVIKTDSAGNVY